MPDDQFGEVEEEEVGEPTGTAHPTTVEELLRYLLEFLPKDQYGNLITISGPISAQGLAQALLSPQGRLWFDSLTIEREATIDDLMRGNLAKLPFKLPRMRTGYETAIGEYTGKISDKKFVEKFLASAGVESIYDLPEYQQRILANAIRQQAKSEGVYEEARQPWGAYGGFARYEDYAAQRQEQERLMREQGADVDMYVAPKTAFTSQGMPTQARTQALMGEIGMTAKLQRAQKLGIDVSRYIPNLAQPEANLEIALLDANLALGREITRREERGRLTESQRLAAEYPEWVEKYGASPEWAASLEAMRYGEAAGGGAGVGIPTLAGGFKQWAEQIPEFEEARQKRRAEMFEKYPAAWGAYEARPQGEMGWEEWLGQEPTAQAYVKAQELQFTQTRQRAQARIAPRRARWIV